MQWIKWTILAGAAFFPALAPAEEPEKANPPIVKLRIKDQDNPNPREFFQVENLDLKLPGAALNAKREKGAYLGVSASPPPPVLRKQLGLHEGMGLVVDVVVPNSPASKAGLQQFDVLEKLNDQLIINPEQFAVLVRSHKPGDDVKLTIIRDGKPTTLTAKLEEHELEPLGGGDWDVFVQRAMPEPRVMPVPPGQKPGGFWGVRPESTLSSITWLEGDRSYTINTNKEDHKTFTVRSTDGKLIFEGPIDSKSDREKVPADLKSKLDKLLQTMPGQMHLRSQSTTRESEK